MSLINFDIEDEDIEEQCINISIDKLRKRLDKKEAEKNELAAK